MARNQQIPQSTSFTYHESPYEDYESFDADIYTKSKDDKPCFRLVRNIQLVPRKQGEFISNGSLNETAYTNYLSRRAKMLEKIEQFIENCSKDNKYCDGADKYVSKWAEVKYKLENRADTDTSSIWFKYPVIEKDNQGKEIKLYSLCGNIICMYTYFDAGVKQQKHVIVMVDDDAKERYIITSASSITMLQIINKMLSIDNFNQKIQIELGLIMDKNKNYEQPIYPLTKVANIFLLGEGNRRVAETYNSYNYMRELRNKFEKDAAISMDIIEEYLNTKRETAQEKGYNFYVRKVNGAYLENLHYSVATDIELYGKAADTAFGYTTIQDDEEVKIKSDAKKVDFFKQKVENLLHPKIFEQSKEYFKSLGYSIEWSRTESTTVVKMNPRFTKLAQQDKPKTEMVPITTDNEDLPF